MEGKTSVSRLFGHVVHLSLFFGLIALCVRLFAIDKTANKKLIDPWVEYGNITYLLYILRLPILLGVPFIAFNVLGLVFINIVPPLTDLKTSPKSLFAPFICFRTVTRGTFKNLVQKNVQKNLEMCQKVGLENFIIEVVTDKAISLPKQPHVREVVVPPNYVSNNKTLYKARALQYCLEEEVNILSDDDWVAHLDEETVLTESSVKGVFNFAYDGRFHFGQGVISYASLGIQNLMMTLADSVRVGVDHGSLRFQFTYLHLPVFSWKGSFVIANAGAERSVTWDHGPRSSIAEDCFFAMKAMAQGYRFGFVQGEMWESSPFSLGDYIKQRRRWLTGLTLVLLAPTIPARCKGGLLFMVTAWYLLPITITNFYFQLHYPNKWLFFDVIGACMTAIYVYLFLLGAAKSFSPVRLGWCRYVGVVLLSIVSILVVIVGENLAAVAVIFRRHHVFEIIEKDPEKRDTQLKTKTIAERSLVDHV